MNCVLGDLAYIKRASHPSNEGKVVRCAEFLGALTTINPSGEIRRALCWRVDSPFPTWSGDVSDVIPEDQLRPIRDQPGEELRIAGLPVKREEVC